MGSRSWTFAVIAWPTYTGTRTHVAVTRIVGLCRILRLSCTSFHSSLVYPASFTDPASGITLPAMGLGHTSPGTMKPSMVAARRSDPASPANLFH